MHVVHTHQHKLDRSHNVLLLMIPGFIFTLVLAVYLITRVQIEHTYPNSTFNSSSLDKGQGK